jgi:hypothetical protein
MLIPSFFSQLLRSVNVVKKMQRMLMIGHFELHFFVLLENIRFSRSFLKQDTCFEVKYFPAFTMHNT